MGLFTDKNHSLIALIVEMLFML